MKQRSSGDSRLSLPLLKRLACGRKGGDRLQRTARELDIASGHRRSRWRCRCDRQGLLHPGSTHFTDRLITQHRADAGALHSIGAPLPVTGSHHTSHAPPEVSALIRGHSPLPDIYHAVPAPLSHTLDRSSASAPHRAASSASHRV